MVRVSYNQEMSVVYKYCRRIQFTLIGSALLIMNYAYPVNAAEQDLTPQALKILKTKCGKCHSASNRKSELDLSSIEGLLKGSESGAIVTANYEDSLLWEMITNELMPPEKEPQLTEAERKLIQRWLEESKFNPPASKEVSQWDVLPIFQLRCVICHGKNVAEAGLDLRSHASILRGGKSGPALVAGKPEQSLLLQRIHAGEMPPKRRIVEASIKVITAEEVRLLEQWIGAGARNDEPVIAAPGDSPDPLITDNDRNFWAFQPPLRSSLPEVTNKRWSQNAD